MAPSLLWTAVEFNTVGSGYQRGVTAFMGRALRCMDPEFIDKGPVVPEALPSTELGGHSKFSQQPFACLVYYRVKGNPVADD